MGEHGFYDEVFESLDIPYEPVRLGGRRQRVRRRGGRRPPPAGQAGPRADPDQHVPGARPPHRPPRSPGRRASRAPSGARPAALRADHLGPAPPVRGRRPGRQGHGHPRRDPPHPARRLLPDPRRRVHAHPGPRAEAVDPAAPRGRVRPCSRPRSSVTSSDRLNAAEVFERFLHSRYVGQKRFGLEGAESAIVLLDTLLARGGAPRGSTRRSWAWPTGVGSTCWPTSWASPTARSSRSSRATSTRSRSRVRATSSTTRGRRGPSWPPRGDRSRSPWPPTPPTSRRWTRWSEGMARAKQDAFGGRAGFRPRVRRRDGRPLSGPVRCSSTATPPSPARGSWPRP